MKVTAFNSFSVATTTPFVKRTAEQRLTIGQCRGEIHADFHGIARPGRKPQKHSITPFVEA